MRNFKYIFALVFIISLFLIATSRASLGSPSKEDIQSNLKEAGQSFESSQERARYSLAEAIVRDKTLVLDNYADQALPDIAYKDNHYYSVFPPGFSFLIAPALYLGDKIGQPVIAVFAIPLLASILSAIFIYLIAVNHLQISKLSGLISAVVFSLTTISWSYSVTLYAHTTSALCLIAGIYFALNSVKGSAINHFLVWLLYGIAILIDYPNALIMLPVVGFMFVTSFARDNKFIERKERMFLQFRFASTYTILPFLLLALALAFYNIKTFGEWTALAHNFRVTNLIENGEVTYQFLISRALDFKYLQNGLFTLLLSKSRGIIYYCPILLFSIYGYIKVNEKWPKVASLFVLIFFINLVIYGSFYDPWGGWAYGPRYLIVAMPVLALLTGVAYEYIKIRSSWVFGFALLFFASFGIALLGALTTNLLPPAAEIGQQIGALGALPMLHSGISGSLVFNLIRNTINISSPEFYLFLTALFALFFIPIFLGQITFNFVLALRRRHSKQSEYILSEKEALCS
ncbi:MAG: hypothetical protein WC107_01200 [Patescibacteria group bacterium]